MSELITDRTRPCANEKTEALLTSNKLTLQDTITCAFGQKKRKMDVDALTLTFTFHMLPFVQGLRNYSSCARALAAHAK